MEKDCSLSTMEWVINRMQNFSATIICMEMTLLINRWPNAVFTGTILLMFSLLIYILIIAAVRSFATAINSFRPLKMQVIGVTSGIGKPQPTPMRERRQVF